MSQLFGGMNKSHDVRDLVNELQETSKVSFNESVAGTTLSPMDLRNMADEVKSLMESHYADILPETHFDHMLTEDADYAATMFLNNIAEHSKMAGALSESAIMPSLVTLTASIATTMRTPYEAVLHRLFDTRTLDKQTVEIEEVIPTLKAPGEAEEEDLIDALSPNAPIPFVDKTEIEVETLTAGLEPGGACKDLPLLEGKNQLFKINRDVRIAMVEAEVDGVAIDQSKIRLHKGSVPYFEAKNCTLSCLYDLELEDGSIVVADISAQIDFATSKMKYLRADDYITKVYFYATVSHHEHTHPIYTSFRNSFSQYVVPTRPHIEVSLPQEMRTDISNSIQHFSEVDVVTAMTENITVISSRMEDQRLKKCLDIGGEYEGEFTFQAPSNFAYGNLEWFKREFIPFLDQCALQMKDAWNMTDCHFRVAVSPYIMRIIDTDFTMDKSMTEEGKGSGVINYSIGCKTSTSTFYFISSQQMSSSTLKMLTLPNNFKNSQVKTYNYFKYSSFLTDQLRRADNNTQPAIVYSERNLPIVFHPLCTDLKITEMAINSLDGAYFVKRAGAGEVTDETVTDEAVEG